MIDDIAELSRRMKELFGTRVELSTFSSGAAVLHVGRAGRLFVLDYSPNRGFGVDEVQDDEGLLVGYRFTTDDFEAAAQELSALVHSSQSVVPIATPMGTEHPARSSGGA